MEFFNRQWATYRLVVEHDLMEHQALSQATATALELWLAARPAGAPRPHLVDLGCGDLAQLAPLLRRLPLGSYTGIDLTASVLPLAAAALGDPGYPCHWHSADLLSWALEENAAPVDLVHSSFAIHHLTDEAKGEFLRGCRRRLAPDGALLWADVFRHPGEDRLEYVERYTARIRRHWGVLDAARQEEVIAHLSSFDHPADRDALPALAAEAGWRWQWLWQGQHQAEALALLQPRHP